jgi:predicted deacetylase
MLNCKKCTGRVFVDRVYSQNLRIELFCIMCGKRWMVKRDNRFASWIAKREEILQHG